MLEEFMKLNRRKPSEAELIIIRYLVMKSGYIMPWEDEVLVAEMVGGNGSLLIIPKQQRDKCNRKFKKNICDIVLKDIDNTDVVVSLNVDDDDCLFELDIWKANYDTLSSIKTLSLALS